MFPDGNNYQEFTKDLSSNFATSNAFQVTNYLTFGIEGIDRTGTDPTVPNDIGKPIWSNNFSFSRPEEQLYIAQLCDDLLCGYKDYNCRYNIWNELKIANPASFDDNDLNIVKCFMTEFRSFVETNILAQPNKTDIEIILNEYGLDRLGITIDLFDDCKFDGTFPIYGPQQCFGLIFVYIWMNENIPTSNPDYSYGVTNYDYWSEYIYYEKATNQPALESAFTLNTDVKFIKISVFLDMFADTNYKIGQQIRESWIEYTNNWVNNINGIFTIDSSGNEYINTPNTLKSLTFTDRIVFAYFYLQQQIIKEAFIGIGLSLFLSLIVLITATNNWIMSLMSVITIFCIVTCVIGFTVIMQWKLGVIEAIIFVMVVGMSVDYVVHLSEAYLHSNKNTRFNRSKRMLGIVGGSVLSGALSTIIGIIWLLPAQIDMFNKFGKTILFLIIISCLFALFPFTAILTSIGPQNNDGNVSICIKNILCCKNNDKTSKIEIIDSNQTIQS